MRAIIGEASQLAARLESGLRATRGGAALGPIDVAIPGVLVRPWLSRVLAADGMGLNVRIRTIGEFGLDLGGQSASGAPALRLSPIAERQLAHDAVLTAGGYLSPVAGTPGCTEAVVRLIRELRMEGIGPPAFRQQVTAPGLVESAEKGETLAALYEDFDRLTIGYSTGATCLAEADPADFAGAALFVYGVQKLATAPRRLIKGIAQRGIPVTFLLPTLSPEADLAYADLLEWLVNECGAEVERLDAPPEGDSTLSKLRAQLFAPGESIAADGPESVRVVSAPSQLSEAREAVRACERWAEQGVLFRDMAVVTKDVATYRPMLQQAFREASIPVYADSGLPLPHVPVGRQLVRLIALAQADLPRRELMAFVAEECTPSATLEPYGKVSAWKWDRLSRRAGVLGGLVQWQQNLNASIDEDEAAVRAGTAPQWIPGTIGDRRQLLRFVEAFQADVLALHGERTLAEHVTQFVEFARKYVIEGPDYLGELDGLRSISEIVGPAVPFGDFIQQVDSLVQASASRDAADAEPGIFMRRGVNLLDASQLPNLQFRAVAILGVNEGKFPSAPGQDPLLLDDERRRLNEAAGWTLPLRAGGHDPGPMQFGLLVHGATDFLQVSYARAARPGDRAMLPSAYLCQVLTALTGRRVTADGVRELRDDPVLTWVSSGRIAPVDRSTALTADEWDRSLLEDDVSLGRGLLFRHHPRALRGEEITAAREQEGYLTPFDGVLADPEAITIAGGHFAAKMTSATRIAKYAKCPRQFFLSSVLNLREEEEPEDILEMQVSTRGTVIHEVLEEFLATNSPGDIEHGNRAALVDQMFALTERHFDVQVRKGKAGRPGLHDRACEEIAAECVAWLDHMLATHEFRPADQFQLEYAFSGLVVPTSRGDIRFRGFIDRLGRHGDGTFSVLDYKSGRVLELEDGEIGDGQDLQLPLYMLAGAEALGMPIETGSAAYEFVSRRNGYVRITLTGRELLAQQGRFQQVMDGIADGVASGDFHAQPSDDACRYCDFKLLCGTNRIAMAGLKGSDPHVATFLREVRGETGDPS